MSLVNENKEKLALRANIKAALADLATAQSTTYDTLPKCQVALRRMAAILEGLIKYIVRNEL